MSDVLNKLRKKRGTDVEVNGDTFHVRGLTLGELRRIDALPNELKTGFVVGCTLFAENKVDAEFPQQPEESDAAWAGRVTEQLGDVPTDTIRELSEQVAKIGKTPKQADVVKN